MPTLDGVLRVPATKIPAELKIVTTRETGASCWWQRQSFQARARLRNLCAAIFVRAEFARVDLVICLGTLIYRAGTLTALVRVNPVSSCVCGSGKTNNNQQEIL
jgi:hypothetical protein